MVLKYMDVEPAIQTITLKDDLWVCRCCLAKITPMLKYIADIKDGKDIVCTLTPLHMHWPCETISLRFEPMRLYMHCHGLLKTLLHICSR